MAGGEADRGTQRRGTTAFASLAVASTFLMTVFLGLVVRSGLETMLTPVFPPDSPRRPMDLGAVVEGLASPVVRLQYSQLLVFLLLLARFYLGAFRFHEIASSRRGSLVDRAIDLVGTLLLFIGLYALSKVVTSTSDFYLVAVALHVLDATWFILVVLLFWKDRAVRKVAGIYLAWDALTLVVFVLLLLTLSDSRTDFYLQYACLVTLIIITAIDFVVLRDFYFGLANKNDSVPAEKGKVYFAAPLFTQAERVWNARIEKSLKAKGFDLFFPQHEATLVTDGMGGAPDRIFTQMTKGVEGCVAVVAIADGADADSGTSWECGYAFALGKPVVAVRTDLRAGGDDGHTGMNIMLSSSASETVIVSRDADVEAATELIAGALERVMGIKAG